jgi:hypothetical protein
MALAFKPDTWTVETASQGVQPSDLAASVPQFAAPVTVTGQLLPKTPDAAYKEAGIVMTQPYKLMMDVADAAKHTVQSRVTLSGVVYIVKTPVKVSQAGLATDHASVFVEQPNFA